MFTRVGFASATVAVALLLLCGTGDSVENDRQIFAALVMHVDPETGNDESCMWNTNLTCKSLEAIANRTASMENLTSLKIVIESPHLILREPVTFLGLQILKIVGDQTHIQCVSAMDSNGNGGVGVTFVGIDDLTIEGLMFEHCGAVYNYPKEWESDYWKAFKAAIHIFNSTNIFVRSIVVSSSSGVGLALSNVNGGFFNISDSLFQHNAISGPDRGLFAGGGGIFVQVRLHLSEYIFTNCTFLNNTASTTGTYLFPSIKLGSIVRGRGHGGGMVVRFLDDAHHNSINIENCNFTRNSAFFGGGLGVKMYDRSRYNFAVVSKTSFEENGCYGLESSKSWSAGGLHLGYNFIHATGEHVRDNAMFVKDSVFMRNCGEKGGGTTFYSSRSEVSNSNNSMYFINCSWFENFGHIGAAVDVTPHSEERLSAGFVPIPEFTDCRFINNSVVVGPKSVQHGSGAGALFSSQLSIKFISSVLFEGNTDSALILVNAVADFSSSNATFINNTGIQGGAISLVGVSSMVIGPGHEYLFLHNKATDHGGAISSYLIDEHDFAASRSCFLQYSERVPPNLWNATLRFEGNEAPIGRSLFLTAITPCMLTTILFTPGVELNGSQTLDPQEVFRWPDVFFFDIPLENQISTEGAFFNVFKDQFEIIPGEEFHLPLNITDDLDQLVDTVFRATIDTQEATDVKIEEGFSYVEDNTIQLNGEEGESGALLLQFVNSRKTSLLVDFVLVSCPVGYSLTPRNMCMCDVNAYDGLSKCDTSSSTAYIRQGFWAGYVNGDSLVTAVCPIGYCHYRESGDGTDIVLPRTSSNSELDSFICGTSRTGILCGECKEGYSAYYHSPYYTCQKNHLCSVGWLFYILSELVPATFLFILVLFFNVRFTSGTFNGIIFFSQLLSTLFVDATDVVDIPDGVRVLSWGYQIIYGFFSLDFFTIEPLSFCLWEGATVLDVLAFKYVTVAYSLILVILVIVFMKYFARRLLGNHLKISPIQSSVIHGISAFLVMCYMQSVKVSLKILLSHSLHGKGGTLLSPARVWFSGQHEVFSSEHLPAAVPAILCLLTLGVIPPILLLAYPLNYRIASLLNINSETYPRLTRMFKGVTLSKLKPFLDSFQGCFKDNFRFFAGLYFVYRWAGLFAYAVSPSLSGFYAILQAMLMLMLLIHAVAQPYVKQRYNIADSVLLTNLALINLLTSFNYYYTRVTAEEVRDQQVIDAISSIQLILIYLPIVVIAVYLVVRAYKVYCSKRSEEVELSTDPLDVFPARLIINEDEDDVSGLTGEYMKMPSKVLTASDDR